MTDHLTGVNVATSGPVATSARSNDGSERVTFLRAQTCQRRVQQPVRHCTAGRAAGNTVGTCPLSHAGAEPKDRGRGASVSRHLSFPAPLVVA